MAETSCWINHFPSTSTSTSSLPPIPLQINYADEKCEHNECCSLKPLVSCNQSSIKKPKKINLQEYSLCMEKLQQLKTELDHLQTKEQLPEETINKRSFIQQHIKLLDDFVNDPVNLKLVDQKVKKIRRRRASYKKNKANRKELIKEKQEQRKRKELEIDQWLREQKLQEERKKEEEALKSELKIVQKQIQKDIGVIKNYLDKLKMLEKFRKIYAQSRQINSDEGDNHFNLTVDKLRSKLLAVINKKKQENNQAIQLINSQTLGKNSIEQREVLIMKKYILESLFGKKKINHNDPYFKYINQGNESLEKLYRVRSLWDVYIDDEGSPLPNNWIDPPIPNENWNQYLK